jgi:nitroreductase
MNVTEAVMARKSIRAFLDRPVENAAIREVLSKAARAPSGGNLQPWRIFVLNDDAQARFRAMMKDKIATQPFGEPIEYEIYPKGLKEPYRTSRFRIGEAMYELLGIPRENKMARIGWMANNFQFFGAPASLFCFIDRCMGPPQWSDLGMYLQTAMLLFQEAGIDTCPQEAWSLWPKTVAEFVGAPEELMLFCGMSIGYKDPEHPVNRLHSEREPLEAFAKFIS